MSAGPAVAAAPLFDALGDPNRLRIIGLLCDGGPSSITQLTADIPVTRQAVTKHLHTLQAAGLLDCNRQGRERIWSVRTQPLGEASDLLAELSDRWDRAIGRLRAFVED